MSSPIKQEHQTTTVKKELGNVSLPSHPLPSPGPPILKKIDYSAAASGDLFLHPAKLTKTLSYDHIVKHRIRLLDSNNSNPVAQQNVSGVDSSAITNTPGESISVIKPKNYRDPSIPFSTLRVKWFAAEKGYGFGVPIDAPATSQNPETSSPDDVFLHQLHIYGSGYRYLFDTQIVEAKIVIETKKNGTSKRVGRMITGIGSQPIVNVEPGLPRAQQKATTAAAALMSGICATNTPNRHTIASSYYGRGEREIIRDVRSSREYYHRSPRRSRSRSPTFRLTNDQQRSLDRATNSYYSRDTRRGSRSRSRSRSPISYYTNNNHRERFGLIPVTEDYYFQSLTNSPPNNSQSFSSFTPTSVNQNYTHPPASSFNSSYPPSVVHQSPPSSFTSSYHPQTYSHPPSTTYSPVVSTPPTYYPQQTPSSHYPSSYYTPASIPAYSQPSQQPPDTPSPSYYSPPIYSQPVVQQNNPYNATPVYPQSPSSYSQPPASYSSYSQAPSTHSSYTESPINHNQSSYYQPPSIYSSSYSPPSTYQIQ